MRLGARNLRLVAEKEGFSAEQIISWLTISVAIFLTRLGFEPKTLNTPTKFPKLNWLIFSKLAINSTKI
jgi:hypothetical protein